MQPRRITFRAAVVAAVLGTVCGPLAFAEPASAAVTTTYIRMAGADRYETAANVAVDLFDPGGSVIVATGRDFADALAAGPVGAVLHAPVLLTAPDALPAPTRQALVTLAPTNVLVVGGVNAVADAVLNEIKAVVPAPPEDVVRTAGNDRYETALKLSNLFNNRAPSRGYIASGVNFPDALAGGPVAGADVAPLLLTRPDDVPDSVVLKLQQLGVDEVVILGGTAAVSQAVEDELKAGLPAVVRRAGADRFTTAAAVSAAAFEVDGGHLVGEDVGQPLLFLVNGERFPDALAAGPPAGAIPGPVLLTQKECIPKATADEIARIAAAQSDGTQVQIRVIGGFDVIGDLVAIDHKVCT